MFDIERFSDFLLEIQGPVLTVHRLLILKQLLERLAGFAVMNGQNGTREGATKTTGDTFSAQQ